MDKGIHVAGVSIAIGLHLLLGAGLILGEGGCLAEASSSDVDERRYVEAALAIKGQEEEQSAQPQKPREQAPAAEEAPAPDPISRDADRAPQPVPEPDPEPRQPADDFDPADVLERNRRLAEDDSAVARDGVDREKVGALDGSEWGTERDARGDPYVGELAGRVKKAWSLPSFERTPDLVTWGCVKLAEDGSIEEREIEVPSKNATLDRSVILALERATDMEEPVPDHLRELLIEQGICFTFRP